MVPVHFHRVADQLMEVRTNMARTNAQLSERSNNAKQLMEDRTLALEKLCAAEEKLVAAEEQLHQLSTRLAEKEAALLATEAAVDVAASTPGGPLAGLAPEQLQELKQVLSDANAVVMQQQGRVRDAVNMYRSDGGGRGLTGERSRGSGIGGRWRGRMSAADGGRSRGVVMANVDSASGPGPIASEPSQLQVVSSVTGFGTSCEDLFSEASTEQFAQLQHEQQELLEQLDKLSCAAIALSLDGIGASTTSLAAVERGGVMAAAALGQARGDGGGSSEGPQRVGEPAAAVQAATIAAPGAYYDQVVALAQRVHLMQVLTERIQEEVVVRHEEALTLQAEFLQVGPTPGESLPCIFKEQKAYVQHH